MYPSTIAEFKRRFPDHTANTIQSLPSALRNASGSNWTVQHLEACRVIVQPCQRLSVLEPYMLAARNTVNASSAEVKDLMRLSYAEISKMNHTELRRNGGVFESFYVALADVSRMPELATAEIRPQRDRKPANRPEYDPGQGLSSPASSDRPRHPTSSPFTPHSEGNSSDYDDQLDRTKHEAVCTDLGAQFVSSVLDRLSGQTSPNLRIEFSRAPRTFTLESPNLLCTCQDDGSIVRRKRNPFNSKWAMDESFLCSLEAKSHYMKADALGKGIISDRVLAQQACEMLGSVMSIVTEGEHSNLEDTDRDRFLISIHQTNIVFLHASFSPEYISYIYSESIPRELPHIVIQQSRAFCLEIPEQRKLAAEIVTSIANFFKRNVIVA